MTLRRLSHRRSAIAVASAALLLAGAVTAFLLLTRQASEQPTPTARQSEVSTGGWESIPEAPIDPRTHSAAVWTGTQLLVWGGVSEPGGTGSHFRDGAIYDPASTRWTVMPNAPIPGRASPVAIWTGDEMIVWGGRAGDLSLPAAYGAAYSPVANDWRRMAAGPGQYAHAVAVWGDGEMLAFTAMPAAGNDDTSLVTANIYDPADDVWRAGASMSVPGAAQLSDPAWTGTLAYLSVIDDEGNGLAYSYDPTTDAWQSQTPPMFESVVAVAWANDVVLFVGSEAAPAATPSLGNTTVVTHAPLTGEWRVAAASPSIAAIEAAPPIAVGSRVLWATTEELVMYEPKHDVWESFAGHAAAGRVGVARVAATPLFLLWGGTELEGSEADGAAFGPS